MEDIEVSFFTVSGNSVPKALDILCKLLFIYYCDLDLDLDVPIKSCSLGIVSCASSALKKFLTFLCEVLYTFCTQHCSNENSPDAIFSTQKPKTLDSSVLLLLRFFRFYSFTVWISSNPTFKKLGAQILILLPLNNIHNSILSCCKGSCL
ncbi:unnamed protein product [Citrullus colocynthis]|uniref:Uncharacterized protein n=1 Tax=Citrullus colocynthis TaxID=252529 RepID=A0ABP0YVQ2_9ROSI